MLNLQDSIRTIVANLGMAVNANMSFQDVFNQAAAQLGANGVNAVPFVIIQTFVDAATGDTVITAPCTVQFRVLDFSFENRGANGANANTVQLCAAAAGASPISDALVTNAVADNGLVRAATLEDANSTIAAGANLYIRRTRAGGVLTGEARILCIPV